MNAETIRANVAASAEVRKARAVAAWARSPAGRALLAQIHADIAATMDRLIIHGTNT